jgi:chemotaxis protein CheX
MEKETAVANCIENAVNQVFLTMLELKTNAEPHETQFTPPPFELGEVNGNVSFTGKMTGMVFFTLNKQLAQIVTARIIGDAQGVYDCEENDVIGELTNMITGNLKTQMADKGYNCQLSIPNVTRGEAISISGRGFDVAVTKKFHVPELTQEFVVRVLVKLEG